jgi:hypothetical protein
VTLRIYADFNSGAATAESPCWCLAYGKPLKPLDEVATELGLVSGQRVILYYEDPSEEIEVDAILQEYQGLPKWRAVADWETLRRIRG